MPHITLANKTNCCSD